MKQFLVSFLFVCSLSGFSQTHISGIVNSYFSVTAINQPVCAPCDLTCTNTITVTNAAGLAAGDKALIIQMKGATINTNNDINGGKVTAINNTGNYEFFEIKSITGNVVTPMFPLLKTYTLTDMVQVVRVPKYTGEVIIDNTLTAKEWNTTDKTGGVLAIETDNKLVFNADIDVSGKGYEGIKMTVNGPDDNCNTSPDTQYVRSSTYSGSYTKGDGIVIDNPTYNRGRAPRANGGGSGVAGDSGGGGGSNYGAGGEGGKRWCDVNGANAGGLGGVSLSAYFAQDRVFLGGAGGSGYVTTNNPSSAADGGGIVILFANEIVGNGHSIIADGFSPEAVNPSGSPDGGGGGGAGGTVVLKTPLFTGNLTVSAKGGDGQDLNTSVIHGPGGGGGGGALLYSRASLPPNVTLYANGGVGGHHIGGERNGSQDGLAGGSVSLYIPIENPNYFGNDDNDGLNIECDLDDDNDGILDTVEIPGGLADPFGYQTGSKRPNFINKDAPGFIDNNTDGIDDRYDNDLDGMINQLDPDSDNDGCLDAIEAYGTVSADTDGNGYYGTGNPPVTNSNGTVTAASYAAPVNTTGTSKPNYLVSNVVAVTTNPVNADTNLGGNATFTAVVTGTHLVYVWKQSTNGGTSWTTVANGGTNPAFSNATTNALTLTNIPRSFDGYLYRLDVTSTSNVCAQPNSDTAVLNVVNRNPVAVDDNYNVDEDDSVILNPLTGDTDADGDTLVLESINGTTLTGTAQSIVVTNGTVNISNTGIITFVPSPNFNSATPVSISYKINDGHNGTAVANQLITVKAVNDAPVAAADGYTVPEGATLTATIATGVLSNDSDIDGDALTAVLVTGPANGTLTLNSDGTFTYVHNGSETVTDSFTYTANDGKANSTTATVTITITPVNDAPVTLPDTYTVVQGGTLNLTAPGVLANDTDAEGNSLTAVLVTGPVNGTLTLNSDGSFTYVHDGTKTATDTFTYRANDGTVNGNIETVTININQTPVAIADSYSVNEAGTLTATIANGILTNDTDAEGNALTAILVTGPTNGTLTLNADGTFTYVHNGSETTTDSFTYKANDGNSDSNTVTVDITINPFNDAPIAIADSYSVNEAGTLTATIANGILANDTDAEGNTLTAVLVTGPTNGTLTLNADGTFTYVHNGSETTTDSFTYKANDGNSDSNTVTVYITINPVNDAPVAIADSYSVNEAGTLTATIANGILTNDTDAEGNTLTAILVTGPTNGTLTLNADGTFTYVHNGSETTTDSFTYKANDGNADSNTVTVNITINPVNDAPVAIADSYSVNESGTLTATIANGILANDTDAEGNALTAILVTGPTNGTLTLNADGTFTYIHNGSETTTDSFTYKANDGNADSNTVTVDITINPVNDAPVAIADSYSVNESGTLTATIANGILANDTDAEGNALTAILVTGPTNGTLTLNADGTFTYVHNGSETTTDSFTYKANDGNADSNTVT
ncbi:Ig-like domain-containing protein, partial [Flavobacterium sp. LC2016-23]|uniref:Ig-like domain-containing protein n=1 Tax=Flavobacterium sp. LC2016-23 TaxID=2666330 RepID=UPI0018A1F85B